MKKKKVHKNHSIFHPLTFYIEHIHVIQQETKIGKELWCLTFLSTIFQCYHGSQFIGGGNLNTCIKPQICHKCNIIITNDYIM